MVRGKHNFIHRNPISFQLILLVLLASLVSACSLQSQAQNEAQSAVGDKLQILATTTLVGDVIRQVGGEQVEVTVLIPPGVDEHGFQPSPQDIARAAQSDLIFINGAGLESFIEKMVQSAGEDVQVVSVSEGIQLQEDMGHSDEEESAEEEAHDEGDPHVWTDPNNVIIWVDNIEKALRSADPTHAEDYQANATAYRQQLQELDAWIVEQVNKVPVEHRKLITDHTVFTYFANRYGFDQIGAVVPGYSTMSQPSAQEMAALEDTIRSYSVPAIFVGNTVNPALAERLAEDTQTKLVYILTGSLTEAGGDAPTYIAYMQYNVQAIVDALD